MQAMVVFVRDQISSGVIFCKNIASFVAFVETASALFSVRRDSLSEAVQLIRRGTGSAYGRVGIVHRQRHIRETQGKKQGVGSLVLASLVCGANPSGLVAAMRHKAAMSPMGDGVLLPLFHLSQSLLTPIFPVTIARNIA